MSRKPVIWWCVKNADGELLRATVATDRKQAIGKWCDYNWPECDEWNWWKKRGFKAVKIQVKELTP